MDVTATSNLYLTQVVQVANKKTVPFYGTVNDANNYFEQMLEGQRWMNTPQEKRVKALISATRRIEQLNFRGQMASADQPLQFPRGTDTTVPVDIEQACYELAQALLKGIDPDTEAANLRNSLQAYGGLRTELNTEQPQPWTIAGIPSFTAWQLLLPYMEEVRGVKLERV